MDLKKELDSVAEAVKKVMEAELSTKQKQIAKMAEPKHKIDAGDLAKLRAGHKPVKEEQEQINEMGYSAKAARAGKDIGKPGKMFAKIAASAAKKYGSEERGKKVAGAVLKKLRMKEDEDFDITDEQAEQLLEAYQYDEENKLKFSEMLSIYKESGLSAIVEEPTEAEFNAEIKDQMNSFMGKKKQPKVSTPTTYGVKNMPEEVEQVEERTLTEPETKKKEEVVKSMKKKMPGFKERYGERAKSVMYATATRIAKEKA